MEVNCKVKCLHNILQNNVPIVQKHEIVTVTKFQHISEGFEYLSILTDSNIELDCLLSSFSEDLTCTTELPDISLQEYEDKVAASIMSDIFNYVKKSNEQPMPYTTYTDSVGNVRFFK